MDAVHAMGESHLPSEFYATAQIMQPNRNIAPSVRSALAAATCGLFAIYRL